MKGLKPGGLWLGLAVFSAGGDGLRIFEFPNKMMKHLHCVSGGVSHWNTPSSDLPGVPVWGVLFGG